MPLETIGVVSVEAHGRAKPRAAIAGAQWYEVELETGDRVWLTGAELLTAPAPKKVTAIAWRV